MFLLWLRQLSWFGDQSPALVPQLAKGRSSPTNTPISPPNSFILPSFVWFYIFFPTGHVLLFILNWYYACASVSESVFLIYPWREMYSTSTYSSAILFSLEALFLIIFRKLHTVVYNGCTNIQSHQQGTKIPFSPHPQNTYYFLSLWRWPFS